MKFTGETKMFLGILLGTAAVIAGAAFILTKPAPTLSRADLIAANAHTKGNTQAKTYLVEFSDFQCPACLAVKPTVDEIIAKHKDNLLFVYRNYPLSQHPFSHQAAQAAESAGAQGKYWEMFDLLFANQEKFSDTIFLDLAKQLKLDETKFATDMKNTDLTNKILDDQAAGDRAGLQATPTFFLNGKKLELSSFADLAKAVDEAIQNN